MYLPVIVTVPLAIWKYAEMKENEYISSFLWVVLITSQHNVCTITDVLDGFFFSHFTEAPFCSKSNFQNGTFLHRRVHLFTIKTNVLTNSVKSHSAATTINFPLPGHGCPFSSWFTGPHSTTFPLHWNKLFGPLAGEMRCYFSDNGILGGVLAHGRVLELGDCLRPFQPKTLYESVILHKSVHKKAVFDS